MVLRAFDRSQTRLVFDLLACYVGTCSDSIYNHQSTRRNRMKDCNCYQKSATCRFIYVGLPSSQTQTRIRHTTCYPLSGHRMQTSPTKFTPTQSLGTSPRRQIQTAYPHSPTCYAHHVAHEPTPHRQFPQKQSCSYLPFAPAGRPMMTIAITVLVRRCR